MRSKTVQSLLSPKEISNALSSVADSSLEDNLKAHINFYFSSAQTNYKESHDSFLFWQKKRGTRLFYPVLTGTIIESGSECNIKCSARTNPMGRMLAIIIYFLVLITAVYYSGLIGILQTLGLLPVFLVFLLVNRSNEKDMLLEFDKFCRKEKI